MSNYQLNEQITLQENLLFLANFNNDRGILQIEQSLKNFNSLPTIPLSVIPLTAIRVIYEFAGARSVKSEILEHLGISNQWFKQLTCRNAQYLDLLRLYQLMPFFNNDVSLLMQSLNQAVMALQNKINTNSNQLNTLLTFIQALPKNTSALDQNQKSQIINAIQSVLPQI